jgi:hypothetical protein
VTKSATDRRGGFGSFVAALPRAAVSAGAATLPAILGVYLYQVPLGFTASFGAYLVAITHPSLPVQGGAQRLATTVLMLSFGAVIGTEEFMTEDLGKENIVGDVFGFEPVATDGAVGAAEVAGFPG